MSDIDDILAEIDSTPAQSQGWDRYAPDFGGAQAEASTGAFDRLSQAGSNIWNQGAGPVNVGQAALAGLEYLASPFTAFGKAIGDPLGRAIGDFTGMPQVGKVVGDTAALAPAMFAPFPGAKTIRTLGEGMGAVIGEAPAAASLADNIPAMWGARGASAARSDIDDALEEVASSGPRTTSRAKTIEEEIALKWYEDQFRGGGEVPNLPPIHGAPDPQDIRLMERGNPKVGERKWAQDESGKPVTMEGYQNLSERPTRRTSHLPEDTFTNEAPIDFFNNAFRRQFEPSNVALGSPPSQMPLRPEVAGALPENLNVDAQRFREMYLPEVAGRGSVVPPGVSDEAARIKGMPAYAGGPDQIDPNLLAELELKFGGKQQGGGAEPPWTQNQNAGIRPIAAPFPGARQVHPWQSPSTPNVMFPAGETRVHPVPMGGEARQNTNRLREDLGLPADAEEAARVSTTQSAPKAAQPTEDPLAAMQKRVDEVAPSATPSASSDLPMAKTNARAYDPKDIGSVIKAIKDSRPTATTPVYYSELMEKIPGVSRGMLDKAFSKVKEGNPAILRRSDPEKGQYLSLDPSMKAKVESQGAKAQVATRAINTATNEGKLKKVYLRNLRPHILQKKDKTVEVGETTMVRHLNKLIGSGELKVYPEGSPDTPLKKITADILGGDDEADFIAEFIKKPKGK